MIETEQENLARKLTVLCDGLYYISETDSPVLVFHGGAAGAVSREELLRVTGTPADAPVEEVGFKQLFEKLTAHRDWHGDAERQRSERFRQIGEILESSLTDLKVFRVGRIRIDIYVVGMDQAGNLTGVMTKAVET